MIQSTPKSFKLALLKSDWMQSAEVAGSPNEDAGGKCVSTCESKWEREGENSADTL